MMPALAIKGGTPVQQTPLPTINTIGDAERNAVLEVLDSGLLSGFQAVNGPAFLGGPKVLALEEAFKRHFRVRHAVAINSCTSGLHAAMVAIGIRPGDEVIVPAYTMSATATCVMMAGGVPIFADISDEDFCIQPAEVERLLTPRTKAVIAVNLFGQPAPLQDLRLLCDRHGLFLIEDNAQAPGALCHGEHAATVGHVGVFSLNRHKTIQCGEGGVLVTQDERLAERARLVRNHGEVVVEDRGVPGTDDIVGYNYRMTELQAAVALGQLEKLAALNARRQAIGASLTELLGSIDGIVPPKVMPGRTHVYYLYAMRIQAEKLGLPRRVFAAALRAEGFPLAEGYVKPIYLQPLFRGRYGYGPGLCPVIERLWREELVTTDICRVPLTTEVAARFAEACHKIVAHRDELRDVGLTP